MLGLPFGSGVTGSSTMELFTFSEISESFLDATVEDTGLRWDVSLSRIDFGGRRLLFRIGFPFFTVSGFTNFSGFGAAGLETAMDFRVEAAGDVAGIKL